jgi:hypothetical protein
LALGVPLSRFTPRVGGGSAFYVRRLHTFMTKRTVGSVFCCLAVILYLARYVFAVWGGGHFSSEDSFAFDLGCVGITPWIFAAAFLIAGIYYLIRAELDK